MANYELVNADQLDSDLTAVGDAIRSKGGTSEKLSFPSGMVSAISAISTGVELNFDVVPGLTQPGTAAENTIWVKTEQIGAWYFSATQPEGLQEWDVWFPTGTKSAAEFNALRKNGLKVYPLSARQYVNGAFVYKTAKSYQGGKWVSWMHKLVENGVYSTDNVLAKYSGNASLRETGNVLRAQMQDYNFASFFFDTQIDTSIYTEAVITIVGGRANYVPRFGFTANKSLPTDENKTIFEAASTDITVGNSNVTPGEYVVNISNVNEKLWFGFSLTGSSVLGNTPTHGYGGIDMASIVLR